MSYLSRYREQFLHNIDTAMHDSTAKNWRDYFIYFLIGSGLMAGAITLSQPQEKKFYAFAAVAGLICGGAASKRDDQHRRVPPSLAANPSRFAADMTIALDNGLAQLQASERAADSMARSAEQFSDAVTKATGSQAPQSYLGKGFE